MLVVVYLQYVKTMGLQIGSGVIFGEFMLVIVYLQQCQMDSRRV